MKGSELAYLPLAEAVARKYAAGRDRYGPVWAGEHPLLEGLADAVDTVVYLREARKRGDAWVTANDVWTAERMVGLLQIKCRRLIEHADTVPVED